MEALLASLPPCDARHKRAITPVNDADVCRHHPLGNRTVPLHTSALVGVCMQVNVEDWQQFQNLAARNMQSSLLLPCVTCLSLRPRFPSPSLTPSLHQLTRALLLACSVEAAVGLVDQAAKVWNTEA
jgi:hypothetical protein